MTKEVMSEATSAKYNKPKVALGVLARFPRSMLAIAQVSEFGSKKHQVAMGDLSYLDVPDAGNVYREAEARHLVREAIEGPINLDPKDGGLLHKAQKAWNALADLEVYLRNEEQLVSRDTIGGNENIPAPPPPPAQPPAGFVAIDGEEDRRISRHLQDRRVPRYDPSGK